MAVPTATIRTMFLAMLAAAVVMGSAVLFAVLGQIVEAVHCPVTTRAEILATQSMGPNKTRVTITATKLRQCDYMGVQWFLGSRAGESATVNSEFTDAPQVRARGEHMWTGLVVDLPEGLIRESSYGIVRHRCHSLWVTETVFFEGKGDDK